MTTSPTPLPSTEPDRLRVVGFDPSMRNWGIAQGWLLLGDIPTLRITGLELIQPVLSTSKQVRQNSLDLETAYQLSAGAMIHALNADALFVEVPVGSQSARAMASYGICVGVLGSLRQTGIPFYEVTPTEVKLAGVGNKNATKETMITWATRMHPEAPWPKHRGDISSAKAEHLADAIGSIYAGLRSQPFQQHLRIRAPHIAQHLRSSHANHPETV